jgi:hypothetical protein
MHPPRAFGEPGIFGISSQSSFQHFPVSLR